MATIILPEPKVILIEWLKRQIANTDLFKSKIITVKNDPKDFNKKWILSGESMICIVSTTENMIEFYDGTCSPKWILNNINHEELSDEIILKFNYQYSW